MRSVRRILVAIKDYEAKTAPALIKAGQLAKALGASIEIFHGIASPLYVDGYTMPSVELPQIEHTFRARILAELEKMATRLRREGVKVTTAAEWDFPVYEAIVRRAHQIKADLIVADQHLGRHTAAGLLHLTDWELLRLSPVPVLLVKAPGTYRNPVVLAALDPGHTYAKPAKLDQRILAASATMAHALRGTQHVMHAYVPFPFAADPDTMVSQATMDRLEAEASTAAQKALDRELRSRRIPRAQRHLVGRHPSDAIPQTARETHSSIVVMGAISRSGLKRLFIGNTAERTLDLLPCDVLIVKPAQFTNRVPRARRGARVVAVTSTALPL
ncbi:MAG TPA: universal stress protein [Steroidobacteraceae bacterium]|nr:universal stress protein [Steroidobacteraceae bacterium]